MTSHQPKARIVHEAWSNREYVAYVVVVSGREIVDRMWIHVDANDVKAKTIRDMYLRGRARVRETIRSMGYELEG